jgi:hypothetical protein
MLQVRKSGNWNQNCFFQLATASYRSPSYLSGCGIEIHRSLKVSGASPSLLPQKRHCFTFEKITFENL